MNSSETIKRNQRGFMQSMLKTNEDWFKNGSIKQINEEDMDEESKRNDS
jgi:hypothetical protein